MVDGYYTAKKLKIYFMILVAISLIITGCLEQSNKYVCSDGTTIDSPEKCPTPSPFEKIAGIPPNIEVSILAAESKILQYPITNLNPNAIDKIDVYYDEMDIYQPSIEVSWKDEKGNVWGDVIGNFPSGEKRTLMIGIDTYKNTIPSVYEQHLNIRVQYFNKKWIIEEKKIPLKIIVHT